MDLKAQEIAEQVCAEHFNIKGDFKLYSTYAEK